MDRVAVDVLVQIRYDMSGAANSCIYTNARKEYLEEILSTWVLDQRCRGSSAGDPVQRDAYTIRIGLVLRDDTFCTESDTGNDGLTCGIVMDVLANLASVEVKTLRERGELDGLQDQEGPRPV